MLELRSTLFILFFFFASSCRGQAVNEDIVSHEQIVLVNVGITDRAQIAKLLDQLTLLNPRVIAIDLQFSSEKDSDGDRKLIEALGKCKNLVMVSIIDDYSERKFAHERFIPGCLPKFTANAVTGFANLPIVDGHHQKLRKFSLWEYVDGVEEQSFAAQIATLYDRTTMANYEINHGKVNELHESQNLKKFKTYTLREVLTGKVLKNEIQDKIVMIGFLGPGEEDKFSSPFTQSDNLDIYGLEFHALVVDQILTDY
jgi:CHASE2 domain-containing sensor protein